MRRIYLPRFLLWGQVCFICVALLRCISPALSIPGTYSSLQAVAAESAPGAADIVIDWSAITGESPSAYGTNAGWSDQDAAIWAARYSELSPSLVRLSFPQFIVELFNDDADPQHINWEALSFDTPQPIPGDDTGRTATLSSLMLSLKAQGVTVMLHFSYLSPWLSANGNQSYPPNDWTEYREFVSIVLDYLIYTIGLPAERLIVEVVNEPDLVCGADPVVPCFWQNWNMTDLVEVVQVTHEVLQAIDPDIRLVGLAECCGTTIVRDLLLHYPQGAYLDGLSYHYYALSGYNLQTVLDRYADLSAFGLPIYLDEYGSLSYRSDGTAGGLWHSWALPVLWQAGIVPVQYPIAETPALGEPYNSMGLFSDWREGWTLKPSYWAYANFFHRMTNAAIIASAAPGDLDLLAVRRSTPQAEVAVWITNRSGVSQADLTVEVQNFPADAALVYHFNNFTPLEAETIETVNGAPLVFTLDAPAVSSLSLLLQPAVPAPGSAVFLPFLVKP